MDTPDFAVNRIRLARSELSLERAPAVHVVTSGAGAVRQGDFSRQLSRGDYFFLPAAARGAVLGSEDRLEVVECLPPA
jgi:mannose-6-phosphate isomerase class I